MKPVFKQSILGVVSGVALVHISRTIFALLSIMYIQSFLSSGKLFVLTFYGAIIGISWFVIHFVDEKVFRISFSISTILSILIFTLSLTKNIWN